MHFIRVNKMPISVSSGTHLYLCYLPSSANDDDDNNYDDNNNNQQQQHDNDNDSDMHSCTCRYLGYFINEYRHHCQLIESE